MCLWDGHVITVDYGTGQKADHMIDNGEKLSERNYFFKEPNSSKKHARLNKVILVQYVSLKYLRGLFQNQPPIGW